MGAFALPAALIGGGLLASSGGSRSAPSPPRLPKPPKPQDMMDVIDEISGTQAITVKGPDGKKRRVIKRLPRTEQEEHLFRQGEELLKTSLSNLKTLYQNDPSSVVDFTPFIETIANIGEERAQDLAEVANIGNIEEDIQAFREMEGTLLTREFDRLNQQTENALIERGHYSSTAGNALRAQMAREEALARQEADMRSRAYGSELANDRLRRNISLYGLREQGRHGKLQQAQTDYGLKRQEQEDLKSNHQEAIAQNAAMFQLGANIRGEDTSKALASRAPQLGLQQFALTNQNAMNRYHADINRLNQTYQNQLFAHQSQPPSFGELLGGLSSGIGGAMLTAPQGTLLGNYAQRPPTFKGYTSSLSPLFRTLNR
jgi:hypothetical protein